jgi:hypothetical protein
MICIDKCCNFEPGILTVRWAHTQQDPRYVPTTLFRLPRVARPFYLPPHPGQDYVGHKTGDRALHVSSGLFARSNPFAGLAAALWRMRVPVFSRILPRFRGLENYCARYFSAHKPRIYRLDPLDKTWTLFENANGPIRLSQHVTLERITTFAHDHTCMQTADVYITRQYPSYVPASCPHAFQKAWLCPHHLRRSCKSGVQHTCCWTASLSCDTLRWDPLCR